MATTVYTITTGVVGPSGNPWTTITSMAYDLGIAREKAVRQQRSTVNEYDYHGDEFHILSPFSAERPDGLTIKTGVR